MIVENTLIESKPKEFCVGRSVTNGDYNKSTKRALAWRSQKDDDNISYGSHFPVDCGSEYTNRVFSFTRI